MRPTADKPEAPHCFNVLLLDVLEWRRRAYKALAMHRRMPLYEQTVLRGDALTLLRKLEGRSLTDPSA